jgi:hypothetical protein
VHYAPGSRAWTDCVRPSRAPTREDGFGVKEKKGQARADCVRPSWAPTRGDGFGVKEKKGQARADCVQPSRAPTSVKIMMQA